MLLEIKKLGEKANKTDVALFEQVFKLYNHMNECDCDDPVKYNFGNILPSNEHSLRYLIRCLNCGGHIQHG